MKRLLFDVLDCYTKLDYSPKGELSEDSYCFSFDGKIHCQAVFDGCGGSGAWKYPEYKHHSGAYIAAVYVSKCFDEWFQNVKNIDNPLQLSNDLKCCLSENLKILKAESSAMGIRGKLVKSFPCTMSSALVATKNENEIEVITLNTGDSRTYVLSAFGLTQLTRDDIKGDPDALDSLITSAPISNMINADEEFSIECLKYIFRFPIVLITASDGVFGYVRSPMDFELLILETIESVSTYAELEIELKKRITRITGDDSTCIMSFYLWNGYQQVKDNLYERYRLVKRIVDEINAKDDNSYLREKWDEYKLNYYPRRR